MKMRFEAPDMSRNWRHVYVVEARNHWRTCAGAFDAAQDLVLTYDFALCREIRAADGQAFYVDYLIGPEVMEANNYLTYEFFRHWFLDAQGRDIFTSQGVPFGFAFRIDIWNDLIFSTRARLCMDVIAALKRERLSIGTRLGLVEKLATDLGLSFERLGLPATSEMPEYFFPIHRWMDEKVRSKKFRHRIKPAIAAVVGRLRAGWDRLVRDQRPVVFIQEYYPTREIIQRLQSNARVRVLLAQYSWAPGALKLLFERPIPFGASSRKFEAEAQRLLMDFRARRATRFVLSNGADFTAGIFGIIEQRIHGQLADALATLDAVMRALDRLPPRLQVMISNLGRVHAMVDAVCRQKQVPSYLLINGVLAHAYLDEAKYADVINAYSTSIRDNYFRGAGNVVCLGDPRMDAYAQASRHQPRLDRPTVVIGASGHNVTNLGSYVAVEFEFLHDALTALETLRQRGVDLRVIVKVRDNGYAGQYENFVREYFPALAPEIIAGTPIRALLERADFYLSIYSQTLFEASCLGVPVVYYKKDTETLFAPFDGKSELVTVDDVSSLIRALDDFRAGSKRFDAFLRREVMEKYIGPLDGRNLERNLEYIAKRLFPSQEMAAA
jgi:hypothetical protein